MPSYGLEISEKDMERIKKLNDADKQQIGLLNYRVTPPDNRMVMCDEELNGMYHVLKLGSTESIIAMIEPDGTVKRTTIQYGSNTENWIRTVAIKRDMTLIIIGKYGLLSLVVDI